MKQKTILILFGGNSPEYRVSLESASSVLRHFHTNQYHPVMVGITPEGGWFHYTGEIDNIAADVWYSSAYCTPCALSPDGGTRALLVFHEKGVEKIAVDAVFPVLHGQNGEDGTVQGLCELSGIPLVGCGTLASALCMDKDRAHTIARAAGIRVPRSFVIEPGYTESHILEQAEATGYPLFIKPVKAGSSFGVTKVADSGALVSAIERAFEFDSRVIAEENIPGFEVGCAVMGNTQLVTGEIDEIELADGFFDYNEKYHLLTSKIHVPARLSPEKAEELKKTAKILYRALDCRGFARVDMFLTPRGEIVFNEINTIPGFTAHSRFPRMMQAAGYPLDHIVTYAVELALTGDETSKREVLS